MERLIDIAGEVCGRAFSAVAVNMGYCDRIIVLLAGREDPWEPKTEHQWDLWFESVRDEIQEQTPISVSAILSAEGKDFSDLPDLFRQAKKASTHKIFYPQNSLLFSEQIAGYEGKYYAYPIKEEEWMTRAIMRGNAEKAESLLREIILGSREYSRAVVNMVIFRVAIALANIIDELQKGEFLAFPVEVPNSVLSALDLNEFESIEEIIAIFSNVATAIIESLEGKKSDRHTEVLDEVKK